MMNEMLISAQSISSVRNAKSPLCGSIKNVVTLLHVKIVCSITGCHVVFTYRSYARLLQWIAVYQSMKEKQI